MRISKIIAAGLLLALVTGAGGFALGQKAQSASTNTRSTVSKIIDHPRTENVDHGEWGVYPADNFFFGGSRKVIQIGLQCISTKQAKIPDEGAESIPGGPASLWTQLTKEEYGFPSDMHILHLAVISPCDPNWAYVSNWQNPNDVNLGFQGASGAAHYFNGRWFINYGTAGQWEGVPEPIRTSFGIIGYSG